MHTEIGWIGMILFLLAYGLVANKKLDSSGIWYNAMQITGASCIIYSLLPAPLKVAMPTYALEACFIIIGLITIGKSVLNRSKSK